MRLNIVLAVTILSGCATDPHALCRSLVDDSWVPLAGVPSDIAEIERQLPHTPYLASGRRTVRNAQNVYYGRGGDLMVCTLERHARDDCSVNTTEFTRVEGHWSKTGGDAVLCNVLAEAGGA